MKLSATFVVSAFAAALVCGLAPGETSAGEAARSSSGFVESVLASHNRERARLGLPSLRWSAKLSQDAGQWAGSLARRGALEHSDGDDGENLWMGSANGYSLEQMVGAFISERRVFRPGRFPNVSRTGDWSDVGHYTQVIWPETQSVGCALARNRGQDVLVCRYWPAGNVYGERVG